MPKKYYTFEHPGIVIKTSKTTTIVTFNFTSLFNTHTSIIFCFCVKKSFCM